jgi:hypothetical protein
MSHGPCLGGVLRAYYPWYDHQLGIQHVQTLALLDYEDRKNPNQSDTRTWHRNPLGCPVRSLRLPTALLGSRKMCLAPCQQLPSPSPRPVVRNSALRFGKFSALQGPLSQSVGRHVDRRHEVERRGNPSVSPAFGVQLQMIDWPRPLPDRLSRLASNPRSTLPRSQLLLHTANSEAIPRV